MKKNEELDKIEDMLRFGIYEKINGKLSKIYRELLNIETKINNSNRENRLKEISNEMDKLKEEEFEIKNSRYTQWDDNQASMRYFDEE